MACSGLAPGGGPVVSSWRGIIRPDRAGLAITEIVDVKQKEVRTLRMRGEGTRHRGARENEGEKGFHGWWRVDETSRNSSMANRARARSRMVSANVQSALARESARRAVQLKSYTQLSFNPRALVRARDKASSRAAVGLAFQSARARESARQRPLG